MKKFVCFMLAALMLVLGVACDGGSGNDDPVKSSGELTADGVESIILYQWKENAWYGTDREAVDKDDWTYDDLKSTLAEGGRWNWINIEPKAMRSFNDKKATKISFSIESDRNITVYIACCYQCKGCTTVIKKVDLEVGVKQNLTFELNEDYQSGSSFDVRIWQSESETNPYIANNLSFTDWTTAAYKITNLKCYVEE